MAWTYEIKDNELYFYNDESPSHPKVAVYQPTWPNGDAWEEGEAETWAQVFIQQFDEEATLLPGMDRTTPTLPKPQHDDEEDTEEEV